MGIKKYILHIRPAWMDAQKIDGILTVGGLLISALLGILFGAIITIVLMILLI